MGLDLQQFEPYLHRGPDQQGKNQRPCPRGAAEQPAQGDDDHFDTRPRGADAPTGGAVDGKHKTVPWPGPRVHADIYRARQPHHPDGKEEHGRLQGEVVFDRGEDGQGKVNPRADAENVGERPPADLFAHRQGKGEDDKAVNHRHHPGGDVQDAGHGDFPDRPGAGANVGADHRGDSETKEEKADLDDEKVAGEGVPADGFEHKKNGLAAS